jgi:hypothetical protein
MRSVRFLVPLNRRPKFDLFAVTLPKPWPPRPKNGGVFQGQLVTAVTAIEAETRQAGRA